MKIFQRAGAVAAQKKFDALYSAIVSTPALVAADEMTFTVSGAPVEQTLERGDDNVVTIKTGEYAFSIGPEMKTIFEDDLGRAGRGRLLENELAGSTAMEWEWDSGISFPPHFHQWTEVLVFVTGSWSMKVGDSPVRHYGPGSVLVIPAGVTHSGVCTDDTVLYSISMPELS